MSQLSLPKYEVGMVVVAPSSNIPYITEDKKYVVLDVERDRLKIQDDSGDTRYYESFLFIEPDVYYSMTMYLTMLRMFDLKLSN